HGSIYEHSYPYLTEQRLRAWKPEIDWQGWNAAVPGYNTSQELAQLLEGGDRFGPDLVIVGFYENDLMGNQPLPVPTLGRTMAVRALSIARRHVYSLELYKKMYLSLAWRLSASDEYRRRLEHLGTEESLLKIEDRSVLPEQRLTPFERLSDQEVRAIDCV